MVDDLDAEIERAHEEDQAAQAKAASARAEAAEAIARAETCERSAELTSLRLQTLVRAAQLRPSRPDASRARTESASIGSRGRQPGAISHRWRNVLTTLAAKHPSGADELAIVEIARSIGLVNAKPKDVRDRMENYETHGFVEPASEGWRVTSRALSKFGSDADNHSDLMGDEEGTEVETADAA